MSRPPFEVQTRLNEGEGVVALRGEVDIATAPELVAAANGLRNRHAPLRRLVIDLSEVTFIDSTGLRAVLDLRREAAEAGLELAVFLPEGPEVRRPFEVAGILPLLGIDERA